MKQLKSLLIAGLLFVGIQSASAQAKVAHINTQELMKAMPEMKTATAQLEKLDSAHNTELNKLYAEFQAKIKQYDEEAQSGKVTEAVNNSRVQEVKDMQNRIRAYEENASKELMQKREEIFKPIQDKVMAAIQKVAKAKGYQYVLDASAGSGILVADGPDLLADVKKELGF
ncbi:hypothetical protein AM493_16390 [Flavobacterium akiainvivens]|uniref:Molecular chaperone Skp n=1 Tax=Flavobacterium akiainvivens TaxID=1202724 RepID=A0A0M8MK30_9FLAO|nr:OmpH family outer membrane protein [Flavobacterium akiainvivens]KOS07447.1 hypothetical protein AM493_16390 [Flavobacterium akiainvivens]